MRGARRQQPLGRLAQVAGGVARATQGRGDVFFLRRFLQFIFYLNFKFPHTTAGASNLFQFLASSARGRLTPCFRFDDLLERAGASAARVCVVVHGAGHDGSQVRHGVDAQ